MAPSPTDTAPKFTFINTTKNSRTPNAAARTTIRQHAMRDIGAARRRSSTYGKRNQRQLPVFVNGGPLTDQPGVTSILSAELPTGDCVVGLPVRSNSGKRTAATSPSTTPSSQCSNLANQKVTIEISAPYDSSYEPETVGIDGRSPPEVYLSFGHGPSRNNPPHHPIHRSNHTQLYGYGTLSDVDSDTSSENEGLQNHQGILIHGGIDSRRKTTLHIRQPGNLQLGNYERLRIDKGFDILNLSTLTTLHLGIATMEFFTAIPDWSRSIFRDKQWSYLSYLPSRYGQVTCLTQAADCVVARVRGNVAGSRNTEDLALSLYGKALRSLQVALNDPNECLQPETLCATELLTLFELFGKGDHAWIRHASGAARLIRYRGPNRFNSEFEKALFIAHAGPIVTEALLNNIPSFLEEPDWQSVFRSTIINGEEFSDRSSLVVGLWTELCVGPGMFAEATQLICRSSPPEPDPDPQVIQALIQKVSDHRQNLLNWHNQWQALLLLKNNNNNNPQNHRGAAHNIPTPIPPEHYHHLRRRPTPPPPPRTSTSSEGSSDHDEPYTTSPDPDKRLEIHGTYLSCLILKYRLLVSLDPIGFSTLEKECQDLAEQVLRLHEHTLASSTQSGLFMTQTVWVGKATAGTKRIFDVEDEEFGQGGGGGDGKRKEEGRRGGIVGRAGMIERWRFERFCEMLGRRVC